MASKEFSAFRLVGGTALGLLSGHRESVDNPSNDFKEKSITFKSLSDGIFDTSTPMGEAIFQIIAILKTMEVNVLRERTIKGIEAARARDVNGGRPAGSYNKKKASAVVALYNQKNTINFIEDNLNISRSTIYQYLRKEGVMVTGYKKANKVK